MRDSLSGRSPLLPITPADEQLRQPCRPERQGTSELRHNGYEAIRERTSTGLMKRERRWRFSACRYCSAFVRRIPPGEVRTYGAGYLRKRLMKR